ncbi:MAG: ABC transporter, partial [Candidatus Dormibacteraeota bacterium]|nr:ABC transporter [Candidatus Dormibacteraeota bacterium]
MSTQVVAFLWRRARGRGPRLAAAAVLSVLCIVSGVALFGVSGYLIQQASARPSLLSLTVAAVGVQLFSVLRGSARYLERLATHDAVLRMLADTRVAVFSAMEPRSPAAYDRDRSGDLMRRVSQDVDSLQDVFARGLLPPIVSLLVVVIAVVITAVLAAQLALAVGCALVVSLVAIVLITTLGARGSARRLAGLSGQLVAELTETLQGAADLIGTGAIDRRLQRLDDL